jgi:hypothetical protein
MISMNRIVVMCLFCSCAPDNGLTGSLSEVFPIDISSIEIRKNNEAIQLTYLKNRGIFLDVVARVSISLPAAELKVNESIALDGDYSPTHPRCVVTHAPGGEPVRYLPPVERGDLVILEGGGIGELTRGTFSILFQKQGGDVGFGRTLNGTFYSKALDAGFGELP